MGVGEAVGLARAFCVREDSMNMPRTRSLAAIAVFALTVGLASQASAITIIRNFVAPGGAFPGGGGTAGSAGSELGGGTIQAVFGAAADFWEVALGDPHVVTLTFGWQMHTGSTLASHALLTQGGSPNRETAGLIRFDNRGASKWFTDPTPYGATEFGTFTAYTSDLGGGPMNVGREWTAPTGDAVNRTDMFAVALQEIGHALGMSVANTSFAAENGDGDIDITAPLPFAGAAASTTSGAHLDLARTNFFPTIPTGLRRDLSSIDVLVNAQISQFTNVNLNPVPEPGALLALGIGVAALAARRRRRRAA